MKASKMYCAHIGTSPDMSPLIQLRLLEAKRPLRGLEAQAKRRVAVQQSAQAEIGGNTPADAPLSRRHHLQA